MERKQFSAGGIVIKRTADGVKVLLIKDRFGKWTWPKGAEDVMSEVHRNVLVPMFRIIKCRRMEGVDRRQYA